MSEPVNPDQTRRWSPPPAGAHVAESVGSGDQTVWARPWYEQQRRPLPPRTDQPPARQPPPAYGQRPPRLQRPAYQPRLQYPQQPQVPSQQYRVPYQQVPYDPYPVLQYPAVPYPQPAPHGPQRTASGRRNWSTIALLVGGGVAAIVVAVVLGLGMVKLVAGNGNELDVREAETGVRQILTDSSYGYGVENVGTVSCNDGANPQARKGTSFVCNVLVDGTTRRVAVVFVDDQGTYEVDRPR
jgi:hypothetical protein